MIRRSSVCFPVVSTPVFDLNIAGLLVKLVTKERNSKHYDRSSRRF
jgi:hypothetical protein